MKISCRLRQLIFNDTQRGRVESFSSRRNEIPDEPVFLLIIFGVQIAEDTEDDRADQIDQQVLHGIPHAYIKIAAFNDSPGGAAGIIPAFYDGAFYASDLVDSTILLAEVHTVDHLYNPVFLHIEPHSAFGVILKEFP